MACGSPAVVCGRKVLAKARELRNEELFFPRRKVEELFLRRQSEGLGRYLSPLLSSHQKMAPFNLQHCFYVSYFGE